MHEIGDADRAGVDVLAFLVEHDAEVLVLGRLLELLEVGRGAALVHVAQGHDVLGGAAWFRIDAALSAASDGGDVQLVVEGLVAQRPQRGHAAVSGLRDRAGQQRSVEEIASGNSVGHYDSASLQYCTHLPISVRTSEPCRGRILELDGRLDVVLFLLDHLKDFLDRGVALAPRHVRTLVLLAVLQVNVADAVVILLDESIGA